MLNTTLPSPGRFMRARYILPVLFFFLVVRLWLPGESSLSISSWDFFHYRNESLSLSEEYGTKPLGSAEGTTKLGQDRTKPGVSEEEQKSIKDSEKEQGEQLKEIGSQEGGQKQDDGCSALTAASRIIITVNTGATEILDRLPTQLRTSLRCVPNFYIFSDLGHMLEGHKVYDSLDETPADVMDGNTDFDIYRKQLELKDPVRVESFLKGMKDPRTHGDLAAWTLDKYKKLHILEKAWHMRPDMDWYLHIDADTYVIWSTLVAWLEKLDPTKEQFLGSLSFINNLPFAHGGSGMLMSGSAMRNFVVKHNGTANKWDYKMHDECCSDWVLAQILKEYGMSLMNSWPTIQGEPQSTIPFDGTHWCQPLATMHHVSPLEARQMGDFEARRKDKDLPLTYRELFTDLVSDLIPTSLDDWDNLSLGSTVPDISTNEDCVAACIANTNCLQSLWKGDECIVGTEHVAMGSKHMEENKKKIYKSFWHKERIQEWTENHKCEKPVEYPFVKNKGLWH